MMAGKEALNEVRCWPCYACARVQVACKCRKLVSAASGPNCVARPDLSLFRTTSAKPNATLPYFGFRTQDQKCSRDNKEIILL
jgi:hypothetical protein